MTLFRFLRGHSQNIQNTPLTDGYIYFCTDNGQIFIDYLDSDGSLKRKQLNENDIKELKNKKAVITVDALPETEPYMILGIKNSYLGVVPATLHVCDGLPETGEDFTGSDVQHYYFNIQDNRVYVYHASNDINSRWIDFCNVEGWELEVTSSYPQSINQKTFYVVIPNKKDIDTQVLYRVEKATDGIGYIYMPDTGAITLQQFVQSQGVPIFEEYVVDTLPETGKVSTEDMSQIYVYLELSSGIAYIYASSWVPLTYALSILQGIDFNNNGFVSSVEEMNTLGVYILKTDAAKPTLHYYDYYADVWYEIDGEGASLTEEEKQALINDLLARLPVYNGEVL